MNRRNSTDLAMLETDIGKIEPMTSPPISEPVTDPSENVPYLILPIKNPMPSDRYTPNSGYFLNISSSQCMDTSCLRSLRWFFFSDLRALSVGEDHGDVAEDREEHA